MLKKTERQQESTNRLLILEVWYTGSHMYLAALANEFLALGALGSDTKDLAARRSLLDAVDVFFRLRTRESLAASSCNYNTALQ